MELPFISSIEKIVFESCKKVYKFVDNKADIWLKLKFSLARYYEHLLEDLNTIHIHRSDKIYKLENIYIPVRLLKAVLSERYLLDTTSLLQIVQDNKARGAKQYVRERFSVLETCSEEDLIRDNKKAIVLGSPGAGKSTILKYCAISVLKNKRLRQIPIYIPLRDATFLKDGILKYISKAFSLYGIDNADALILELLQDGKLVILLDGLDEVPLSNLTDRINEILEFATKYRKNRFYVACRIDSYEGQLAGFKEFELDVFDDNQIEQFVTRLLFQSSKNPYELIEYIKSLPQIRELSTSPLLLSLICIVYDYDLEIPYRRTTLYKRCLECLIRDWDAQRNFRRDSQYNKLDEEKKISLLSQLAFKLHSEDRIHFQIDEVRSFVSGIIEMYGIEKGEVKNVLNEIRSHTGIITQVSKDYLSFSHLTLQEYMTARYLCDNHKLVSVLQQKWRSNFWQEIFILSASILPDATAYLQEILTLESGDPDAIILAAHCLSVDPIAERPVKELIVNRVIQLHYNTDNVRRDQCMHVIARIDRTFVGQQILKGLGVNFKYLKDRESGA